MIRKLMAKRAGTITFILIAFLLLSPLNDCQGTSREDIVDAEVYHYLDTEAYVPVIAVYNKKPDLEQAFDNDNTESTSAQTVVSKLQKINRECEAQIFSHLKEEMARNNLLDYNSLWVLNAFSARVNKEGLKHLSKIPQIKMIRLDRRRQYLSALADPSLTKEIFLENFPGEGKDLFNLKAVNVPPLWEEGYFGKEIVVAVMDTGVDLNHPALEHSYRGNLPGYSNKDSWFDATKNDDGSTEGPGTHTDTAPISPGLSLAEQAKNPWGLLRKLAGSPSIFFLTDTPGILISLRPFNGCLLREETPIMPRISSIAPGLPDLNLQKTTFTGKFFITLKKQVFW